MLHTIVAMISPGMERLLIESDGAILMLNISSSYKNQVLDKPLHKMLHKTLDKKKTEIQASFRGLMWRARGDLNPRSPASQASVLIRARRRAQTTGLRRKNEIINTLLKLKGSGLEEGTLRNISYCLTKLDRLADLNEPESTKLAIAGLTVENSYKTNLSKAYNYYTIVNEIKWTHGTYPYERKLPNIPTKENILKIISHAKKYAPIFKTLMETGLMPYELSRVDLFKDVDYEKQILNARGYKGHASRIFKLTAETTAMLKTYTAKYEKFPASEWMSKLWRQHRNAVSKKLAEPQLRNIRLYDLRHRYATELYRKTRDILLVKQQLGHKKLETTMIYTQLTAFDEEEEYTCKAATTIKEATQLIENGFEYVTEMDGIRLFRKRK
jgi:integrase